MVFEKGGGTVFLRGKKDGKSIKRRGRLDLPKEANLGSGNEQRRDYNNRLDLLKILALLKSLSLLFRLVKTKSLSKPMLFMLQTCSVHKGRKCGGTRQVKGKVGWLS